MDYEYKEIDLKVGLLCILNKWWLIIILIITGCSISYYVTKEFVEPTYEAKTTLFIGKEQNEIAGMGISLSDLQTYNQLIVDYQEIAKTRLIIQPVIDKLGINMDIENFQKELYINTIKDSRLFTVSFRHSNPQLAAAIANLVATELQMKATEVINVENVRIIDEALVPISPIKPNIAINTTITGFLGFLFSLMIISLMYFLNNTIKTTSEIEKKLGITVIGTIPLFKVGVK